MRIFQQPLLKRFGSRKDRAEFVTQTRRFRDLENCCFGFVGNKNARNFVPSTVKRNLSRKIEKRERLIGQTVGNIRAANDCSWTFKNRFSKVFVVFTISFFLCLFLLNQSAKKSLRNVYSFTVAPILTR